MEFTLTNFNLKLSCKNIWCGINKKFAQNYIPFVDIFAQEKLSPNKISLK